MTSHAVLSYVFLLSSSCQSIDTIRLLTLRIFILQITLLKNKNKNEEAALQVPIKPQHLFQCSVAGSHIQLTLAPSSYVLLIYLLLSTNIV